MIYASHVYTRRKKKHIYTLAMHYPMINQGPLVQLYGFLSSMWETKVQILV